MADGGGASAGADFSGAHDRADEVAVSLVQGVRCDVVVRCGGLLLRRCESGFLSKTVPFSYGLRRLGVCQ
eukprot:5762163-Amphidinium_carterae.2